MGSNSVKSADRTLAICELFSQQNAPLSVGEVSRGLSIPQSSTTYLLRSLSDLGYLSYGREERRFYPTIRLLLLGSWITRQFGDAGSLVAQLERLKAAFEQATVFVAIQTGSSVQPALVIKPSEPRSFSIFSDRPSSLIASSPGRALLSLKSDQELLSWARRGNAEESNPRLRVRESEFLDDIHRVQQKGYALTDGIITPERCGISIAVPALLGAAPFAIGLVGPRQGMTSSRERIVGELLNVRSGVDMIRHPTDVVARHDAPPELDDDTV